MNRTIYPIEFMWPKIILLCKRIIFTLKNRIYVVNKWCKPHFLMQIYKIFFLEGHNFLDIQYDLLSRRGGPDTADHWIPIPGFINSDYRSRRPRHFVSHFNLSAAIIFDSCIFFFFWQLKWSFFVHEIDDKIWRTLENNIYRLNFRAEEYNKFPPHKRTNQDDLS